MPPFWETVLQFSLAALWRASWQGSLAIAVALLIESFWKNMPLAWRSWLWRLVFVKLLLAACIPGSLSLPILPATKYSSAPVTEVVESRLGEQGASINRATYVENTQTLAVRSQSVISYRSLLLAMVYIFWVIGFLSYLSLQQWHGRRVMARLEQSRVILHRAVERMLQSLATSVGLKQLPQVRLSPGMGSPCVIGGMQPIILLPLEWLRICTQNQLRLAVAHELAHLVRGDLAWNRVAAFCQAAFFFHPLVWLASRRYHVAQELACDELALGRTNGSPAEYARLLLQFVEQPAEPHWAGAVAMTGATVTLRERILAMNHAFSSNSPTLGTALLAALLATLGFVPLSLAEQKENVQKEIKSSSESNSTEVKPSVSSSEKKSSSTKKSISASASASSSSQAFGSANGLGVGAGDGEGFGLGAQNGQGNGIGKGKGLGAGAGMAKAGAAAKAEAKATVAVSIGTDDEEEKKQPESSSSQPQSPKSSAPKSSSPKSTSTKSSTKQKMSSTNNGDGEKWTRTTEAVDDSRDIKIEESNEQIRMTIKEGSNEQKITVSNAKELEEKHPAAYEIYQKYAGPKGSKGTKIAKDFGVEIPKEFSDKIPKEFGEGIPKEFGIGDKNSAAKLLQEKLQELIDSDDIRGTDLEKLLEEAKRKLDEE